MTNYLFMTNGANHEINKQQHEDPDMHFEGQTSLQHKHKDADAENRHERDPQLYTYDALGG